jgi:hypothetical protein
MNRCPRAVGALPLFAFYLLCSIEARATDIFATTFSTAYTGNTFFGFAYDPDTDTYYSHEGISGETILNQYNTLGAFASNTPDVSIVLVSPSGLNLVSSYFAVAGGQAYGRSTSDTAELSSWQLSDGTVQQTQTYPDLDGVNGNSTFSWGGNSGMNIFRDASGMVLFAKKADQSVWTVSLLAADLSITNLTDTPLTQVGWALLIDGIIYASEQYSDETASHAIDVSTGQDSAADLHFIFSDANVNGHYISDTLYDPIGDRLFLWDANLNTLFSADNVAAQIAGVPEPGTLFPALAGIALFFALRRSPSLRRLRKRS